MKCPDCGCENIAGEEACESCSAPLSPLSLPEAKAARGVKKKLLEGTISELGVHDAVMLPPQARLDEAIRVMRERRMGCILAGEGGKLLGICTERDILIGVAGLRDPAKLSLSSAMRPDPQVLREEDSIAFAFHHMALRDCRHIPILRKNGAFGVVSSRDLLRYLCR